MAARLYSDAGRRRFLYDMSLWRETCMRTCERSERRLTPVHKGVRHAARGRGRSFLKHPGRGLAQGTFTSIVPGLPAARLPPWGPQNRMEACVRHHARPWAAG
jgi:hypothetical protein